MFLYLYMYNVWMTVYILFHFSVNLPFSLGVVAWFTTTYAISAYHPLMLWVRISIRARYTTLCDKVCQWLATGRWFSPDPPVSSTNKSDRHDITEILLKVVLNSIKQTTKPFSLFQFIYFKFSPKKRNKTFLNHYIFLHFIRFRQNIECDI